MRSIFSKARCFNAMAWFSDSDATSDLGSVWTRRPSLLRWASTCTFRQKHRPAFYDCFMADLLCQHRRCLITYHPRYKASAIELLSFLLMLKYFIHVKWEIKIEKELSRIMRSECTLQTYTCDRTGVNRAIDSSKTLADIKQNCVSEAKVQCSVFRTSPTKFFNNLFHTMTAEWV